MWRTLEPSFALVALAVLPLALDAVAALRPPAARPVLPRGGFGVTARDEPLTAEERSTLGGIAFAKKRYAIDGRTVVVLAIDAAADRHVVHDPAYCLTGKGFRIVRDEARPVASGTIRLFRAERAREVRTFACFFESGPHRYVSRWTYFLDYLAARWSPWTPPPLRYVVALAADPSVSCDFVARTALPRLFGPGAR